MLGLRLRRLKLTLRADFIVYSFYEQHWVRALMRAKLLEFVNSLLIPDYIEIDQRIAVMDHLERTH